MTEDGIVREISSQSSLGSSSPEKEDESADLREKFAHLICFDESSIARSVDTRDRIFT
jgi:hypothetical protein